MTVALIGDVEELEPGHIYRLPWLEADGHEVLRFVRRSSRAIDYGDGEHPGTNSQRVMRALIARGEYLNSVLPSVETMDANWYLRMALFCYEARAWRRKQAKLNKSEHENDFVERYKDVPFSEHLIEMRLTGEDGHIIWTPS